MLSQIKGRFYPITDLQIELYLCDELSSEQTAVMEAAIGSSHQLKTHIAERRAEKAAFYFKHPRLETAPSIYRLFRRRRLQRWSWAGIGMAAAAILALTLLPFDFVHDVDRSRWNATSGLSKTADQSGSSGIRARGSLKITLVLRRGQEVRRYRNGEPLYQGDQVRLAIQSHKSGYLTVIAKDDKSDMTVYYDAIPTTAGSFTVPDSLLLDDYLGTETWLILLAGQRRSPEEYIAKWLGGETIFEDNTVISIVKEKRP